MLRDFDLTGKKAPVAGAGRGIGRGIALALAEAGADVVVACRTRSDLESLALEVKALGRDCFALPTDLTQSDEVDRLAREAPNHGGRTDILVNNVGKNLIRPIITREGQGVTPYPGSAEFSRPVSGEGWFTVLNANLTSAFFLCQAVGSHMTRRDMARSSASARQPGFAPGLTTPCITLPRLPSTC